MKWSSRGACAALSSCSLLSCALCATAVGLKCFWLGSELRGEPFRLDAAAGAFYSGLLLLAGLSLLGPALLCYPRKRLGQPGEARQPLLLLAGMLLFLLGVLSAFAGAVIDGDSVALAERQHSRFCLQYPSAAAQEGGGARAPPEGAERAKCAKLKDYQRGLLLSSIFNSLECLLGLLNLLLVKNYTWAQHRRRLARRRANRHSTGSMLSVESEDCALPRSSSATARPFQPVSCLSVGLSRVLDEAGVEVHRGGHPSVELPGYAPTDPELNFSYPYSYALSPDYD